MSRNHEAWCYFFAVLNILMFTIVLIYSSMALPKAMPKPPLRREDQAIEVVYLLIFVSIAGPALAHIWLSVVLIVGTYKRRPAYVRMFTMFILVQLFITCIYAVCTFSLAMDRPEILIVFALSVVLFRIEAWITGNYYKILVEELRDPSFTDLN